MKILAVCAHGLGSSFLMEMNIKKALKKLGIEAEVEHSDLSVTGNDDADLFVMGEDIAESSSLDKTRMITLKNLVSSTEYEEKLKTYFDKQGR
ncbi:PTS sugar transporter subunit IIB [Suttonella ornithocola]|uniref:PTS system ascorbate-specific transporter subunits IICB n=1 Tax=Suttonella ornithocola TaxID=279832 RepID=A0A380MYH5_9GAMM|nr:PTS sugar transporter subunit IIB [Suttonella ornithocola]SUO97274.1 PTS system ascorbate-specific transporter subunits IICB [Suttonella ornithocola]